MDRGAISGIETSSAAASSPGPVSLYEDGWSIRRISAELSMSRSSVHGVLERAGVEVAAGGAGRPRAWTRIECPDDVAEKLRKLYVDEGMTRREVAESLGLPEGRVRRWLGEIGVESRTRGRCSRDDRDRPQPEHVEELYVEEELPAREVGRRTSTTTARVLETLHESGLPVRLPHSNRTLVLLEELYGDPLVRACLARHQIPVRLEPGPLTVRFPSPVSLSHSLLKELYERCGLSVVHIELVTGQPADTVRARLHRQGIRLRRAGGLSPFLRRVRERQQDEGSAKRHQASTPTTMITPTTADNM